MQTAILLLSVIMASARPSCPTSTALQLLTSSVFQLPRAAACLVQGWIARSCPGGRSCPLASCCRACCRAKNDQRLQSPDNEVLDAVVSNGFCCAIVSRGVVSDLRADINGRAQYAHCLRRARLFASPVPAQVGPFPNRYGANVLVARSDNSHAFGIRVEARGPDGTWPWNSTSDAPPKGTRTPCAAWRICTWRGVRCAHCARPVRA
jgi:hypothetical protein